MAWKDPHGYTEDTDIRDLRTPSDGTYEDQSGWSWFHEGQNITVTENNELDITSDFWREDTLTADQLQTYETWYIDSLYGTTDRKSNSRNVYAADLEQGGAEVSGLGTEQIELTWGMDLVRTAYTGGNEPTIPTAEHFEWLTRGQVDWAWYQDSPHYKDAWRQLVEDGDGYYEIGDHRWDEGDWDHFFDKDATSVTIKDKIEFIRTADRLYAEGKVDPEGDDFWTEWDNQYASDYIHEKDIGTDITYTNADGTEKTITVTAENVGTRRNDPEYAGWNPTPLFDAKDMESRVTEMLNTTKKQETTHPAITEKVKTPTEVTTRPDIQIETVKVQRPANIPKSWGEV